MKDRGKSVKSEQDKRKLFSDSNFFSSTSDLPCKKHPLNSSTVGICAYCLSEKLMKLVCSDCGERKLSSCSCSSDLSSYRNSSCTVDVGSVGRISFLIEKEKDGNGDEQKTLFSHLQLKQSETDDDVAFKRCNSCVADVKKSNGFWRIGKLFKKKREKEGSGERNRVGLDQKSDVCVMDVSRSRSLSSFIGDKFHHEICSIACSSEKFSGFNESEPRESGFKGDLMDFQGGFPVKETDFSRIADDDDEFIDLKFDLYDKSKTEQSYFKKHDQLNSNGDGVGGAGGDMGSSSCRIMVNDRGIKKVKNSHMQSWKWVFKHHSENNDHNHILKS